ncbi:DNA repair protein RecN [Ferrimicrobium acidiphilum]|uniref:DNA repair protein RecN n=1 Tax=Ferrimicrobium acidiphilum TaxID=121039 RepID=UPI0023F297DF|nr:AAA family ATPase [Ferrimicrobium acidiphilum]
MLESLIVENLGVIEYAELEFQTGLVVITGETGAGKTLLTTALGLLLGARGSPELIGPHGDRARVAAQLDPDGTQVLLRRELTNTGRNQVRIDREAVTLAELSERTAHEVEIFGQHLAATLTQPSAQLLILDKFGSIDDSLLRELRAEATRLEAELAELRTRGNDRMRRLEFVNYELGVLRDAKLEDPEEDEKIEERIARLALTRDRQQFLSALHDLLVGEAGITDEVGKLNSQAKELMPEFSNRLVALMDELDDLAHDSRIALENEVEDPQALAELEDRLGVLVAMKRRFGGTLHDVLQTQSSLELERSDLEDSESSEAEIIAKLTSLAPQIELALHDLRSARHRAAEDLVGKVEAMLTEVALVGAQCRITFDDPDRIIPTFLFTANPGIPPMPLGKVASGGELSRLMLAIARVAGASTPTLIFDEIDAGIGGSTGLRIAEVLRSMAGRHQVLVVTHLAQIAAAADQHVVVTKSTTTDQVATSLQVVTGSERVREIARMLSGHADSPQAQEHAKDLIARFADRSDVY